MPSAVAAGTTTETRDVVGQGPGGPVVAASPCPTFAGIPLQEPRTAEVHLAVAPHGQLDPAVMPNQITMPIGSPPMWWLAIFA